jgi:hypothetical protein
LNTTKEVLLDVDKLLNCHVKVFAWALGAKIEVDLLCDMDVHHPAMGASNSCFFLASPIPS